jgi:hypothetical protein
MKFKEHVKRRNLEQLTDAWAYLTPAQRLSLRVQAQTIITRRKTNELIERTYNAPIQLLNNLLTYTHPAHWAVAQNFSKKKNRHIAIIIKIFIVLLIDILIFII